MALIVTIFQGIQAKETKKIFKTAIGMVKISPSEANRAWLTHLDWGGSNQLLPSQLLFSKFFGLDALKYCYYQCQMLKTSYFFGFWWKTATPKIGIPRLTYLKTFKMSLNTLNEKTRSRGLFYMKSNPWKYIWMMKKNP